MLTFDVVIPTYNRPRALERCLAALAQQCLAPASVVVVDDHGSMPAADVLPRTLFELLPLTVIRNEANLGPSASRNRGVAVGSAPFVLFVDDDVVADEHLVARHACAHQSHGPGAAVIGPLRAPADWRPTPWNRWEAATLEVEYARMQGGEYRPTWRQFFTGNASVARLDLERAGGFDPRLRRAEDIELAIRLERLSACSFAFEPSAIGWHYAERSAESWLGIAGEYARIDFAISALYPHLRWIEVVEADLRRRHLLTRAAARFLRATKQERRASRSLLKLASLVNPLTGSGLASPMLSAAYSIEYRSALRRVREADSTGWRV